MSSTKKARTSPNKNNSAITSLVESMGRFTQTSSTADHLRDLHDRVSVDEASLLEHRSKLLTFGEKYAESMEKLQSDLIDETDFLYVLRKNAYEKCVEQISNLEKRIDETKALINKSVAAENENNESGDDAGSVSSGESQNPLSGITPRNVFSPPVSPQPSNDGSRMLDDDEIPNADEFD